MSILSLDLESGVIGSRDRRKGALNRRILYSTDYRLLGNARCSIMSIAHISTLTALLDLLLFQALATLSAIALLALKAESHSMVYPLVLVSSLYNNGYVEID